MIDIFEIRYKAIADYRLRTGKSKDETVSEYIQAFMLVMDEAEACNSFDDFINRLSRLILKNHVSLPKSQARFVAFNDASEIALSVKKRY